MTHKKATKCFICGYFDSYIMINSFLLLFDFIFVTVIADYIANLVKLDFIIIFSVIILYNINICNLGKNLFDIKQKRQKHCSVMRAGTDCFVLRMTFSIF